MSKLVTTLGLGLILASTAANAAPASKPAPKPRTAADQTYCIKFEGGTGTRISTTECRTKREWKRLGVDLDNPSES